MAGGTIRDITRNTYYLDRAINQGDQSLYALNIAGTRAINRSLLRNQRLVFMASEAPSSAEINALQRYIEEGGSVLISFDDRSDISAYNRLLGQLEVAQIDEVIRARTEQGYDAIIGEVDLKHPVFFRFYRIRIRRHFSP